LSLVPKKKMPSKKDIKDIADRAEKTSAEAAE
jgi:hypothetical protein